jgi:AraC family transcriptional regulator
MMIDSLTAGSFLKARMTACSWEAGWRSLLMRAYVDPPVVDDLRTPPTADPLIVLVTDGRCDIEVQYGRRSQRARYGVGSLGMTTPGDAATLGWKSDRPHATLQLHLPAKVLRRACLELAGREGGDAVLPSLLQFADPVLEHTMLALRAGLRDGLPDLYAETASEFLAVHLLTRHAGVHTDKGPSGSTRLRRVDDFLQANLDQDVRLEALADLAGLSRFHLLRVFRKAYGETPLQRLTRLRMERAKTLLASTTQPVTAIALKCGYSSPTHFSAAFRRCVGVTPSAWRNAP